MACRPWPRNWAARSKDPRIENSAQRSVRPTNASPLLDGLEDNRDPQGRRVLDVWMSHGDRVVAVPPGFKVIAASDNAPLAAMADESRRFYGLQFHPEVTHSLQGGEILRRFVREIAGCGANWATRNIIEDSVARIRAQVGRTKCCWDCRAASIRPCWPRCCIRPSALS